MSQLISLDDCCKIQTINAYHSSDHLFNVGDKLIPRRRETVSRSTTLFLERIFENVRQREYPDRPSRFDVVFVSPYLSSKNIFYIRRSYNYEVECIGYMFQTDSEFFNEAAYNLSNKKMVKDSARKYWQGISAPQTPEILVKGDVTIIRQIQQTDRIDI